jgi:high affinity Mn2+ porin
MSILTQDTPLLTARRLRILRGEVRAACAALNFLLLVGLSWRATSAQAADESRDGNLPPIAEERFAIHGQFTYVEQETEPFRAPYAGTNSLSPNQGRETTDITLYGGARLWSGAEIWINPEIDQGFGLDDTLGVAGFPSGEAYKVGKNQPYFRLARLFVRETLDLDGDREAIAAGANQLAGSHSANRWVLTVGKFSVADVFDTNQYAHDPRNDFLNWAAIDTGTFDYAADAWGYTVGAAAEWYQGAWTVRAGVFDGSNIPNSVHLEPGVHELQVNLELEKRHEILGHPGKLMLTAFETRARLGLLDEAVQIAQATGNPVDIVATRQLRDRVGADFNLEQELARDLGMFARVGKTSGNVEAYEFADIDRTLAAGLSLKGSRWDRADDTVGLAGIVNHISAAREEFLNAGGLGILIGDGQLPHPGPEQILETYYNLGLVPQAHLSLDYQFVKNPAYNRDRGPVSIFAVRFHAQF